MSKTRAPNYCLSCGKPYHRPPSGAGKFCSRACAYANKPTTSLAERLWRRVDKSGGPEACWIWQGAKLWQGYGSIASGGKGTPRLVTHRVAYELAFGAIPPGLKALHRCDNRACCNPAHIFLGTQTDNMADMVQKGRNAFAERHGLHRLKNEEIAAIRKMGLAGHTGRSIAKKFGISEGHVSLILLNKHRIKG